MAKKIHLKYDMEKRICKDFSNCEYLKVDWMRENFCYQGGGCPEQNYSIMKNLIKESLR